MHFLIFLFIFLLQKKDGSAFKVPVSLGFYQCTVCSFSKKCAHVQRRYPFFCHDPKSKSTRDPIYRVPTMEYLLTTSCTLYEIHKFCILPGTSTVAGTC